MYGPIPLGGGVILSDEFSVEVVPDVNAGQIIQDQFQQDIITDQTQGKVIK